MKGERVGERARGRKKEEKERKKRSKENNGAIWSTVGPEPPGSQALCWLAFCTRLSLLRLHPSSLWPQGTQETHSLPLRLFYKQCLETTSHYQSSGQPVRLSMPLCEMPLIFPKPAALFP